MLTLKQLEALEWVSTLGSFERAALKLGMTQSAISKRIQDLEATLGIVLFDRLERRARLTTEGRAVLALAQELLGTRDRILTLAGRKPPLPRLRFGVTELTALTWLPAFVGRLREVYPSMELSPQVERSVELFGRLRAGAIDFIVVPDAFRDPHLESVPLASVDMAWMCAPELARGSGVISVEDLSRMPLLILGDGSGSGIIFRKWLRENGAKPQHAINSNSLLALVGLAIAGAGVGHLPRACFHGLVARGVLRNIESDPPSPRVNYIAMFRRDGPQGQLDVFAQIAHSICDFGKLVRWI